MADILDDISGAVADRNTAQAAANARIAALEHQLAGASPSGEPMPDSDVPGFSLIWNDDFDIDCPLGGFPTAYAGRVDHYPPTYFDTSRNAGRPAATQGQYDAARTVSVSNSVLRKWLHSEYDPATQAYRPKVCALLPVIPSTVTSNKWRYQTYGRYAIRARVMNPMPGFKFAWLLWPQSDSRPLDGEIDNPEQNFDVLSQVGAFVHHAPDTPSPAQHSYTGACDLTQWHTFVTEWSPNLVRVIRDGVEVMRDTDRIPSKPMRWVIQTETTVTAAPPAPTVQGIVEIDWSASWKYAP